MRRLPFENASFDIEVSQEAFCHIPEGKRLLAECARVLTPGGRLVFTDVLSTDRTSKATLDRLQREMTFCELIDAAEYVDRLERSGFRVDHVDNLGSDWQRILTHRLAMYRGLEGQTVRRFGYAHLGQRLQFFRRAVRDRRIKRRSFPSDPFGRVISRRHLRQGR